jgi:hypothetical protein
MRCLLPATFLALALLDASLAAALTEPQSADAPAATAPAKPSPPPAAATSPDNDAAAKHAKRTACVTEARTKKLVGAQKTAYIKECVGPS